VSSAWDISNEIIQFVLFVVKYFKANKKQKNTNYLIIFVTYSFYVTCVKMLDCSLRITYYFLSRSINKWYIVGAYWQQARSMTVNNLWLGGERTVVRGRWKCRIGHMTNVKVSIASVVSQLLARVCMKELSWATWASLKFSEWLTDWGCQSFIQGRIVAVLLISIYAYVWRRALLRDS